MNRIETSTVYRSIDHESRLLDERNDCAVRAVTAVTGRTYAEVHRTMKQLGRKNRKGTPMTITETALKMFGYRMICVPSRTFIDRYPGRHTRKQYVTTHHPDRFKKIWEDGNNYLFRTSGHILAVLNGTNVDWTRGKACRVRVIYRVVKQ